MKRAGKWFESSYCYDHDGQACDCDPALKTKEWLFMSEPERYGITIQQFHPEGPFYGTWEAYGGGRTGAYTSFELCKTALLAAVERASNKEPSP